MIFRLSLASFFMNIADDWCTHRSACFRVLYWLASKSIPGYKPYSREGFNRSIQECKDSIGRERIQKNWKNVFGNKK